MIRGTAIVIDESVSDVQLCGDEQPWQLGQCSLVSSAAKVLSSMAAFEFGKKKNTIIFGFEGKPNCSVLFWMCSFPFLSY